MPAIAVRITKTTAEIKHGPRRARFLKRKTGWVPDYFYLEKRKMLRFKDHEWMSVSNLRAPMTRMTKIGEAGLRFEGQLDVYDVKVEAWVQIEAAPDGPGFQVTSGFKPVTGLIEIFEAGSAFECPYEYDFREDSTTLIGGNPVYKHRDSKVNSGLYLESALWVANRRLRARQSYVCWSPLLLHRVRDLDGGNERCITILGHWDDTTFHEVYATPTRGGGNVAADDAVFLAEEKRLHDAGETRGYKYLMGCTNWSSSMVKDPSFFVRKGQAVHQKVTLTYDHDLGELSLDAWVLAAWQRVNAFSFPQKGVVKAYDVATHTLGVTWEKAAMELTGMFRNKRYGNVWDADRGMQIYLDGSRPTSYGYHCEAAMQWYAPCHYWGVLRGDDAFASTIARHAARHGQAMIERGPDAYGIGDMMFTFSGIMRLLEQVDPRPPSLEKRTRDFFNLHLEKITGRSDPKKLNADYGMLSFFATSLLIAARVLAMPEAQKKALLLLRQINAQLNEGGQFWRFGCGRWEGWCQAGRQIRAAGPAQAAMANLMAYHATGNIAHLTPARQFMNLVIGLSVNCWNASPVEDMDTRGFTMGGNCGRDQLADLPPWETFECIRSICALMEVIDAPPAWYDAVFLASRTGLCSMPAARTWKRAYDLKGNVVYEPVNRHGNLQAIYNRGAYIAYENPWDQTMQAPYQGVEPIMNHLTFGGGVARVEDERLLAIVPRVASYRQRTDEPVSAHIWNPTNRTLHSSVVFRPTKDARVVPFKIDPRSALHIYG